MNIINNMFNFSTKPLNNFFSSTRNLTELAKANSTVLRIISITTVVFTIIGTLCYKIYVLNNENNELKTKQLEVINSLKIERDNVSSLKAKILTLEEENSILRTTTDKEICSLKSNIEDQNKINEIYKLESDKLLNLYNPIDLIPDQNGKLLTLGDPSTTSDARHETLMSLFESLKDIQRFCFGYIAINNLFNEFVNVNNKNSSDFQQRVKGVFQFLENN